jgi:hypothetical protein
MAVLKFCADVFNAIIRKERSEPWNIHGIKDRTKTESRNWKRTGTKRIPFERLKMNLLLSQIRLELKTERTNLAKKANQLTRLDLRKERTSVSVEIVQVIEHLNSTQLTSRRKISYPRVNIDIM